MTYRYKNTSPLAMTLPNLGVVEPGEMIDSTDELFHPELELVKKNKDTKPEAASTDAPEADQEKAEEHA